MPERAPALLAAIATVFCGCGYTSTYVPPDGWRARPLYNGNEVVMVGSTDLPECVTEEEESTGDDLPPRMMLDDNGYWVPAPRVHVVFWGPVFHPHPFMFHPPGPHNLILGSLFKGGGGGGGGGNGKAAGMVLAFAAAIAVVASSGVAIGLAADPPEDDDDVAEGIDQVNVHNDLVRERIAECIRLAEARRASPTASVEVAAPAAGAEPAIETVVETPVAAPTEPAPPSSSLRPTEPSAPSLQAAPSETAPDEADLTAPATLEDPEDETSTVDEEVPW